ncbi:hypothetical protein CL653_03630 [bacterium]|nr:hypothetical protein [bacterium]|tara:strand:- start:1976 stop:2167 length:192 start_codon:yes stop_codon:yes gene_type:complete
MANKRDMLHDMNKLREELVLLRFEVLSGETDDIDIDNLRDAVKDRLTDALETVDETIINLSGG